MVAKTLSLFFQGNKNVFAKILFHLHRLSAWFQLELALLLCIVNGLCGGCTCESLGLCVSCLIEYGCRRVKSPCKKKTCYNFMALMKCKPCATLTLGIRRSIFHCVPLSASLVFVWLHIDLCVFACGMDGGRCYLANGMRKVAILNYHSAFEASAHGTWPELFLTLGSPPLSCVHELG